MVMLHLVSCSEDFIGGGVGNQTPSDNSFLGVFDIVVKDEVRPVAIIVLDSPDVKKDVDALREFVTKEYGKRENIITRIE